MKKIMKTIACILFLFIPAFAANPVKHIVIIIKENRSLDEYFGTSIGTTWGFANQVTPQGNCKVFANSSCSSSPISLFHGNPALDDGFHTDVLHTRQSLVDQVDGGAMDGAVGISSVTAQPCWWNAPPPGGETCVLNGSQGASGSYVYFNANTDLPFYFLLYQTYGLAVQHFPYATPSYPDHLAMITARNTANESVDNPYTGGNISQWTCDENNVGGSTPTGCTSGASPGCSAGGFEYSSQVLSRNTSTSVAECIVSTNANGTSSNSIAGNTYYLGGNTGANVPCVCAEGTSLSVTSGSFNSSMPNGTCTVNTTGTCSGATATCTVGPSSPFSYPVNGPAWGGNKGTVCPGGFGGPTLSTIFDLLDIAGVSWGVYAPVITERGYNQNIGALVAHIRYGTDWTNFVHPWQQFTSDVATGNLPQVVWIIPPVTLSEHPNPNATALAGQIETQREIQAVWNSDYSANTIVFVTWDDPGGFYDHLAVPAAFDSLGYGPRVPMLCAGPYCKHALFTLQTEPASIIRCVEDWAGITPSLGRDVSAQSLCPLDNTGMVNYGQTPIPPPPFVRAPSIVAQTKIEPDLVTLVKKLLPKKKQEEREATRPELNPEHCFAGTRLGEAYYQTKTGKYKIEVCHSPDWAEIYRVGENPMDDDEPDAPKSRKK